VNYTRGLSKSSRTSAVALIQIQHRAKLWLSQQKMTYGHIFKRERKALAICGHSTHIHIFTAATRADRTSCSAAAVPAAETFHRKRPKIPS
jgi:hypothetical protein